MIIIPELKTVVLLVPRTGSGTLRRAIAKAYPQSLLLYRHMEADGIPQGYERWRKIGVVREPVARLWSLYKFMSRMGGDHDPAYIESMRRSTFRPFDEWILHNETVFTCPYDSANAGRFYPVFTVRYPMPENRKSQWVYLRPDLGTHIYRYDRLHMLAADLQLPPTLERHNLTDRTPPPVISDEAKEYVKRCFAWDIQATRLA